MELTAKVLRMNALNIFRRDSVIVLLQQSRNICAERTSLIGRDFISPQDFTPAELKSFMWTAVDLKTKEEGVKSRILQNIKNCNATVIMNKPHIQSQVAISNALFSLGCFTNFATYEHQESSSSLTDLGRSLSKLTNIIVTVDCHQDCVKALSDGASVPVLNFNSTSYQMIQCLANLLSVQERYGFLRHLKIGWIGPCNAELYTYILLSPTFKMNVQFMCVNNITNSPKLLNHSMKYAVSNGSEIKQCLRAEEAIYRAHVIITTMHSCPELQITQKLLSEAAVNWTFLHCLPRSDVEVSSDVVCSKNSLVWDAYENVKWILMAVVTRLLREYSPACKMLDFEGDEVPPEKFYQN